MKQGGLVQYGAVKRQRGGRVPLVPGILRRWVLSGMRRVCDSDGGIGGPAVVGVDGQCGRGQSDLQM